VLLLGNIGICRQDLSHLRLIVNAQLFQFDVTCGFPCLMKRILNTQVVYMVVNFDRQLFLQFVVRLLARDAFVVSILACRGLGLAFLFLVECFRQLLRFPWVLLHLRNGL